MGKQAVSFEGSVTTTGRSEAVRLEKAFFRAHPEFRQKARVRAQAIGEGHVLVSVAEPLVPTSDEVDPVVSAYLSFLEADMVTHPERLSPFSSADLAAARELSDDEVATEYDALFGGVGKPEVYLFGSHYLSGFLNEKPLVRLRDDLAELGLGRSEDMPETEDHAAYILEVMRFLIAGDDVTVANLSHQQAFFTQHVQPWLSSMCQVLVGHPRAVFYARVAAFTDAFLSVEVQGFDLMV